MLDSPSANHVKGVAVVATLRFLKERFGEAGVRDTLAGLDAGDRQALEAPLVSAWYPLPLVSRLMRQAEAKFGSQIPHIHREMGRASADYGLSTVYKIFLKVGSPQFIISKGARVFSGYYRQGNLVVTEAGHGFANCELHDFPDSSPEYCERIHGWINRTMELCGTHDLRTSHVTCVHRGDAVCRYEGTWK